MKLRDRNRISLDRRHAATLNLLDLSETKDGRRGGNLYWVMLVSMIGAYGAYMATIANMERAPADGQNADLPLLASAGEIEALEKADREPIETSIPRVSKASAGNKPAAPPKLPDRLPELQGDRAAPEDRRAKTVEPKPPAREEAAIVVHAMTDADHVSSAARAILRRIHEAAHRNSSSSETDGQKQTEPTELAETTPPPPLPERRPYISSEIARHQLSSQSGASLTPAETRTATVPSFVRSYRQQVRAHLAAHRPSGGFGSGSVSVSFRLSADGKIRSAQVIQAPEAEDLDDRALSAIYNAAPFPAAPDNTAARYRAFTVSFVFE